MAPEDPYDGDVLLRDCVERALSPHRERLSEAALSALREYLILFVVAHPAAEPLYGRLRKQPEVQKSTWIEKKRAAEPTGAVPSARGPKKARGK